MYTPLSHSHHEDWQGGRPDFLGDGGKGKAKMSTSAHPQVSAESRDSAWHSLPSHRASKAPFPNTSGEEKQSINPDAFNAIDSRHGTLSSDQAAPWSSYSAALYTTAVPNSPFPSNHSTATNTSSNTPLSQHHRLDHQSRASFSSSYSYGGCSWSSQRGSFRSSGASHSVAGPSSSSPTYPTQSLPEWVAEARSYAKTSRTDEALESDLEEEDETLQQVDHSRATSMFVRSGPGRTLSRKHTIRPSHAKARYQTGYNHSRSYSSVAATSPVEELADEDDHRNAPPSRVRSASDSTSLMPSTSYPYLHPSSTTSSIDSTTSALESGGYHRQFHQHTSAIPWLDGLILAREQKAESSRSASSRRIDSKLGDSATSLPSAVAASSRPSTSPGSPNMGLGLTLQEESRPASTNEPRKSSRRQSPALIISQTADDSASQRMVVQSRQPRSVEDLSRSQSLRLPAPAPLRQGDLEMLRALNIDGEWANGDRHSRTGSHGDSFFPSNPRRSSLTKIMRRTSAEVAAGAAKAAVAVSKSKLVNGIIPKRKSSRDVGLSDGEDVQKSLSDDLAFTIANGATSRPHFAAVTGSPPSLRSLHRQQSTDSIDFGTDAAESITIHSSMPALPSLSSPSLGNESDHLPGTSHFPSQQTAASSTSLYGDHISEHPAAEAQGGLPHQHPALRKRGFSHSHLFKMHLASPAPSIPEESFPLPFSHAPGYAKSSVAAASTHQAHFSRRHRSNSGLCSVRTSSRDSLRSAAIAHSHSRTQLQAMAGSLMSSSTSLRSRKSVSTSSLKEERQDSGPELNQLEGQHSLDHQEDEHDATLITPRDRSMETRPAIERVIGQSVAAGEQSADTNIDATSAGKSPDQACAVLPSSSQHNLPLSESPQRISTQLPRSSADLQASTFVAPSAPTRPTSDTPAAPVTAAPALDTTKRKEAPPPLALSFSHRATSAYRLFAKKSSSALSSAFSSVTQPSTPLRSGRSSRPTSPVKQFKESGKQTTCATPPNQSPVKRVPLSSGKTSAATPMVQIAAMNNSSTGGTGSGDTSSAFGGGYGGGGGGSGFGSGHPSGNGGGQRRPNGNPNGGAGGAGGGHGGGNRGGPGGYNRSGSSSSDSVSAIFKRLELVGRGAYGAVYRGVHQPTGNVVALKVVNLDTPDDDVSDIQREVALLSQLREAEQKNVVRYWGCWLKGPELWIVMDFAEGGSVRTLMRAGNVAEQHAVVIVRETLVALAYLHKAGIIHRDIKAANVLLTNMGKILLCDFGVAASLVSSVSKRTTFVGTPYWMAPEVITTGKTYDQSADIWSLGITIYEMVTGNPPLADQEQMRAIMLIPKNKPPRLPSEGPFSSHMRDFVATCLNEEARERPTAEELSKSKWIKSSSKVSTGILKDLIAAYTAWTKSGGMRMSLLGAEAADLDAGNRDSFAYDNADMSDGWEFGTVRNSAEFGNRHMGAAPQSYDGFDGRQAMTPSSSQQHAQQPPRDHPLLRLFRPEGMEMEDLPMAGAAVNASQPQHDSQPPPAPPPIPPAASSGLLAHYESQDVRPAPPPPVPPPPQQQQRQRQDAVDEGPPNASSAGGNADNQSQANLQPAAPALPEKPSFTGTGASPFRFGAPAASTNRPKPSQTPEPPAPVAQTSPSKRWPLDHRYSQSRMQRPSQSSAGSAPQQAGDGSENAADRNSESPVSSGHGRFATDHRTQHGGAGPHHWRMPSSASAGSLYSKVNSADQSPVMLQNGHLPAEAGVGWPMSSFGAPSRPWTSGDSTASRPRNDSFGSQTSGVTGENGALNVPLQSSQQPSLLGPRARSGSRSRAGPGGDVGVPPVPVAVNGVHRPGPSVRDQLSRLQMPREGAWTASHGEGQLPASPGGGVGQHQQHQYHHGYGVQGRNNSQGNGSGVPSIQNARRSPLSHLLSHHERRHHGGSDPTAPAGSSLMGGEEGEEAGGRGAMVVTSNGPAAARAPQLAQSGAASGGSGRAFWDLSNARAGPTIRPLDLSRLTSKEAVHEELAKTVDDLGAWLDTLAFSLVG